MRSGEYKFTAQKNESDINQYYLESTVGGVFDMLYHIKPLTEVLLKADPLEVIGSENDRKAFYELKVILATLDLSSSAAKVAATATPVLSPSSTTKTAMYPFDMIPFLKALGECNGIDYLHSKQQQIPFLSFWDDVIRLILVVIPPLREVFLGLFASAHQVPGWLNLVSESQRCFHVDLPSAPSSSSVKKDSVPSSSETEVYSLEEIFKDCLNSNSAKMEVDVDDNVDNAEKLIQMNAMILKRAPTVLAISVTSPMSNSLNTSNTSTSSSSSSASSSSCRNAVSLKIPLQFDLADCGFHDCVDQSNCNSNNSRVELLDEEGASPTSEAKAKVDVNYILCGVSLVNQHEYVIRNEKNPDEMAKCPDYMFRLIEDNASSDPAKDDNDDSISKWQQVCVGYSKSEGQSDGEYVSGCFDRPSPISMSTVSTVLSNTNTAPPRFLVYVRKDLFGVLDRISHLVSKAGQMRALGDVAFALAMNTLNYNEARRCYEEAIILDPSLKPELQDNFNALEKIEKTHKARLLEEQADLALANRRFREASDLYSRAMMSAVAGSGVYLWAREKFEYVTRIISLECACQYAEKGADALVVGNFLSAKEYFALAYKFNPELIHLQSIMLGLERALQNHNANQKLTDATSALKSKKFSLAQTLMLEAVNVYPEKLSHFKNATPALEPFIQIEEAIKIHKHAQQLTSDKKFAEALELYGKAIKLVPSETDVEEISKGLKESATEQSSFDICYQSSWSELLSELLGNCAYCYFELKQYPEAIENCERALEIKPDSALAHFGLGNINFALEKYDDSGYCYKRALECDPGLAASVKVKTKQLATAKEVQLRKEREIQKAKEKEELRILMEERKLKEDIAKKEKQERQEREKQAKLEREQKKIEERARKAMAESEAAKEKQAEKERLRKEKQARDAEKMAERERVKAEKEKERERMRQEKERKLQEKLKAEADEKERQRIAAENIQKAEARKKEIEREKEAEKEKARLEMERTIAEREKQRQEKLARQNEEKARAKLENKQPSDPNSKSKIVPVSPAPTGTPQKADPNQNLHSMGVFHTRTPGESPAPLSQPRINSRSPMLGDLDNTSSIFPAGSASDLLSDSIKTSSNIGSLSSTPALDGLLKPSTPTPNPVHEDSNASDVSSLSYPSLDLSAPVFVPGMMNANKSASVGNANAVGTGISRSPSGVSMPGGGAGSATTTPITTSSKANLREDIIRNIHQGVSISSTMHSANIHNMNHSFQAPTQTVTCEQCHEVCDGVNRIVAYGSCNHLNCCSLCIYSRRSLLNNMTCPYCSQRCDAMICTSKPSAAYNTLALPHNVNSLLNSHSNSAPSGTVVISDNIIFDKKSRLFFPKEYYQNKILYLGIYTCPVCNYQDMNPDVFQMHLYSLHGLGLCHNCVMHKAIFPAYHMAYTMESLRIHMNECLNSTGNTEELSYKSGGVHGTDGDRSTYGGYSGAGKQRGVNGSAYGLKKVGLNPNSAAFDSTSAKFEEEFPSLGGSGLGGSGLENSGPSGLNSNSNILSSAINMGGVLNSVEPGYSNRNTSGHSNSHSHSDISKKESISALGTEPSLLATMLGQSYTDNPSGDSTTPPPLPSLPVLHDYNPMKGSNMSTNHTHNGAAVHAGGSKLLSTLGYSTTNTNANPYAQPQAQAQPNDNISSLFSDLLLSDSNSKGGGSATDGLGLNLYGNQNQNNFQNNFLGGNLNNSLSGYGQSAPSLPQPGSNQTNNITSSRENSGIFDMLRSGNGNEVGLNNNVNARDASKNESALFSSFLSNSNSLHNASLDSLNGLLSNVSASGSSDLLGGPFDTLCSNVGNSNGSVSGLNSSLLGNSLGASLGFDTSSKDGLGLDPNSNPNGNKNAFHS